MKAIHRHGMLFAVWTLGALGPAAAFAAFEDLGAGARAPGMGGAFVAVADDVYAIYYNPAGLGTLDRPAVGTSYTKLYLGLTDDSNLASSFIGYAQPIREGRQGALGAAWNSFSLNGSLYRDDSFFLSYGRQAPLHPFGGDLYAGVSLKYLRSSFGTFSEAANATNGLALTGQPDSALGARRSVGAFDSDLGLLYRFANHYSLGAQAVHVNRPNVAFDSAASDRLPTQMRLGFGYRSLVSNLTAEVDTQRSPTGSRDTTYIVGAERWFPRLFVGDFGLRGGLGLGGRDYTQLSAGLSYRTRRLQVDYGFALPINTVSSTGGNHRVAIGFKFGRATEEEESIEMVLEAMRRLKEGRVVAYEAQAKGLSQTERAALDEFLAQARSLELDGRYKEALDKLSAAMGVAPADKALIAKFSRLNFVAQQIPALPGYKSDPMQAALHEGLGAYLAGDDRQAVEKTAEALSLKPDYRELNLFLEQLERLTGFKRPEARAVPARALSYAAAAALTQANSAVQERRYGPAVELSLTVLQEDPDNLGAWQNLGISHFALNEFEASLKAWRKAYALEKDPRRRAAIRGYLRSVQRASGRIPEKARRVARLGAAEIRKLYDEGVDSYARRQFAKAKESFEKILESDPDNEEARKALSRVLEELK